VRQNKLINQKRLDRFEQLKYTKQRLLKNKLELKGVTDHAEFFV